MAITVDTLNALTEKFWVEKAIQDLTFKDTPTLRYLRKYERRAGGTACQFDIEYARLGGGWRTKSGTMTLTTPEIATKGELGWRYLYVPVELEQADIDINESDPRKVASYLNRYTRSALKTADEKWIAPALFTAQTGQAPDSIVDAVSDSATYAGLAKADIPSWRCVTAEATYSTTPDKPVSPSLGNFRRMIRAIQNVSGKKPQLIVTSPDVYDRLADQIEANDQISAARAANDVIKWGFDALFINGVPVVDDLYFADAQCADFVGTGGNRANCAGHQALFLNFEYLFPYYMPGRNLAWDKLGWASPINTTQWVNKLHWWGNFICTNRRAQGRLYGIDPEQDETNFTNVEIDLTPFAVV
jgi:hypothetical protein